MQTLAIVWLYISLHAVKPPTLFSFPCLVVPWINLIIWMKLACMTNLKLMVTGLLTLILGILGPRIDVPQPFKDLGYIGSSQVKLHIPCDFVPPPVPQEAKGSVAKPKTKPKPKPAVHYRFRDEIRHCATIVIRILLTLCFFVCICFVPLRVGNPSP